MRKVVIAGNWKMFKTQAEAREFLTAFIPHLQHSELNRTVVLCVPFTDLPVVGQQLKAHLALGAQNVHWQESGAFTGEIAAPMLVELGVSYVIVGHSERREFFGETDASANQRLRAAQRHGLTPILCVGESKQHWLAGETEAWITGQLQRGLQDADPTNLVIAYEPIWAIGTGETCDCQEANRVIGLIRSQLSQPGVSILYGGSVKSDNIDALMAQPEIDGVLVGGASLDAESFARIVNYR